MCELAQSQFDLCLLFFYVGVGIGVCYDLIRLFRRIIDHKLVFITIEDLIFWLFVSIYVLYKLQKYAYGDIRFYMIMAILVGLSVYWITISCTLIKPLFKMLYEAKKYVRKSNNMLKNHVKKGKIKISTWMKDGKINEKIKKKEIN